MAMCAKLLLHVVIVIRIFVRVESREQERPWHDLAQQAEAVLWKDCGTDCVKAPRAQTDS
jgi:hypothetical protein